MTPTLIIQRQGHFLASRETPAVDTFSYEGHERIAIVSIQGTQKRLDKMLTAAKILLPKPHE